MDVSIIIPARDEAGNISKLLRRLPKLSTKQELIFVEGHSSDGTWDEIAKQTKSYAKARVSLYKQKGKGKADAVRLGFSKAQGKIIMILDADLSVDPEELSKFYKLLRTEKARFANGSRFIYKKEAKSMRRLNSFGNMFFAFLFSLILKEKITDTLCGTKALFRNDYQKIKKITKSFSSKDPYGDFELLLGAAILGLKIKEIPVRYKARVYGKSKISRFTDGFKLFLVVSSAIVFFIRKDKSGLASPK